ncbi:MAG: hypothetical protein K2K02_08370 [Ruminococcus sp.]|nr:hypothetical protein [Ruminococcus sp.]
MEIEESSISLYVAEAHTHHRSHCHASTRAIAVNLFVSFIRILLTFVIVRRIPFCKS